MLRRTGIGDAMNDGEIIAWHYFLRRPMRLRWRKGIITELKPSEKSVSNDTWLAPGLFDPQVNGYGGVDFQQDGLTADELLSAAGQLRRDGCTRFLLTLITDEWSRLTARLRHLRAVRSESAELQSAIAGWHIEGPFLSAEPGYHGAHDPELMIDPKPEHIRELRKITGKDPLLLTVAPERPGVLEAIKLAVSLGIKVSLGHTNASAEILAAAIAAGATGFTHLGNGCPWELDRADNIILRVLDTPGLTAGLIPDQIHVTAPLFRLIHRVRDPESISRPVRERLSNLIYYTTDAMSAAGAPPGRYRLGALEIEVGADQVVRHPGRTNLAGSALRPIDGVFRAARMLDCVWSDVWDRFGATAANLMELAYGLEPRQPADFCVLKLSRIGQLESAHAYAGGAP
jgi:N-acetylglucosamine-6-phosphate deacetylase